MRLYVPYYIELTPGYYRRRIVNQNSLADLVALITELVNEDHKPWTEKRREILALLSDDERIALEEFISWFDQEDR